MDIAAIYHRPDSEMAYLREEDKFEIRLKVKPFLLLFLLEINDLFDFLYDIIFIW